MVTRVGGMRRKSRYKFSRTLRQRGKVPISSYLQALHVGTKVQLVANTFEQGGLYHPRYHGQVGVVVGQQGVCYKVQVKLGNQKREFLVHPVHLRKVKV
ncbi:MAG: 50S ribosomal protein L21e [Candidatus Woesearchaeota archaeon]